MHMVVWLIYNLVVRLLRPMNKTSSIFQRMITGFIEFPRYRELLYSITMREVLVRYKQSFLGIAWAILQPLAMMVIFTIVFSRLIRVPSDGIPYPIFSYSALLPWSFFSSSLSFAIPSLVNNANLIKKTYFPREIFPCASILAASVDFGIAACIFILMMIYYRVSFTWNILYVVPLVIIQFIFTLGISLFAAAVNVRYRDVKYALPLLLQVWMYITPVIYPISMVPIHLRTIYMLNPMTGLIDGYRRSCLLGLAPNFNYFGVTIVVTVVVFFLSYWYFKKEEMTFADIV